MGWIEKNVAYNIKQKIQFEIVFELFGFAKNNSVEIETILE